MATALRPWLGFRLDCVDPLEPILAFRLADWLDEKCAEGLVSRWFFLWYADEGYHLRLRVQPGRGTAAEQVASGLFALEAHPSSRFRVTSCPYDRHALAFGDTLESVLAELLHVATSKVALHLLRDDRALRPRPHRWVLTAAVIAVWLRAAMPRSELHEAISAWLTFARRAAIRRGYRRDADSDGRRTWTRASALIAIVPRIAGGLERLEASRHASALLRRLRERGAKGRFAGAHALHLFCNEMGLAFDLEWDMAEAVQAYFRSLRQVGEGVEVMRPEAERGFDHV